MIQYCRYCAYAVLIGEDIVYCEVKKQTRDKSKCMTPNKCKRFGFNEIDVFDTDKKYQPKKVKRSAGTQMRLEEENE